MPTRQDLAAFLHSQPGVDGWYGGDKIDAWANGIIQSFTYEKWYTWFVAGQNDSIIADIIKHTGLDIPFKNTHVYQAIIDFLSRQLQNQLDELTKLENSGPTNPDNNPLAIETIQENIARTEESLKYYTKIAADHIAPKLISNSE